jgi:TonB family protein
MDWENVMEHQLSRNALGQRFAAVLLGVLAFAQITNAMSSSDADPPSSVGAADGDASHSKPHFSAQALQAMHLKGQQALMQIDTGSHQEVGCFLSLWYSGDGTIQAVQLAKASGFPSIDKACLQAVIGRRIEGLPSGDSGGRRYFPIDWVVRPKQELAVRWAEIKRDPAIPQLPSGGGMHPLPNYPADALTQQAHGICEMHIAVLASGVVASIEITQSTGSQALDQACKDAIYQSPFVPATQGDQPVNGTTEVAILWRLPRP